jgi:hypothetical protein
MTQPLDTTMWDEMAKEPLSENQKFALLMFGLVLIVGVVLVMLKIQAGINSMF